MLPCLNKNFRRQQKSRQLKIFGCCKFVVKIGALLFILTAGLMPAKVHASEFKPYTLSGYVKDKSSGETLIGVSILVEELKTGAITNTYGFYSISLPAGTYKLRYSYLGYKSETKTIELNSNLTINIYLEESTATLKEVEILGDRTDANIKSPEMSIVKLDVKTINRIPALLGEVDILKALQMLPGVQATSEGSTGFSVRGGNPDQNLIILDEATVYNAAHLMGFFSVFNNDVIKDVTLYKGDIPASYAGRLSSLLDVRMKDGDARKFVAKGSVGTVSSKLSLEGPIIRDRTTFIVSGRRTYADLFLPFARDKEVRNNTLFFYDLNAKVTHMIDNRNRLYISGYLGRDIFKNRFAGMGFGNRTASLRWNHLFSEKIFFNFSVNYSAYDYLLGTPEGDVNSFTWTSGMEDHSARFDFTHYLNSRNTLRYGITSTFHKFNPGSATGLGGQSILTEFILPPQYALEHGIYLQNEQKAAKFTFKYGIHYSLFQNAGKGVYYRFDSLYQPIDSIAYGKGEIFNHYSGFEPRISVLYILNSTASLKASYSHTRQYLALAQNSTAGTPLDIWFPATPNVKPQSADLFAAGYFRNFQNNTIETSVELFYKHFLDVVDFRNHAQLLLNQYIEGELRTGSGYSYGLELFVRKNRGKFGGWISYTYARAFRNIPEISPDPYPAPYDKPHTINVVMNFEPAQRWIFSANWVYASGLPYTFPTGRAVIGNAVVPVYSERNAYRLQDYHRLDASATLKGKQKAGRTWYGEWNLSVYNVYNRKNTWSINFEQDKSDPNRTYAIKTYLFSVIPAITYSFNFSR